MQNGLARQLTDLSFDEEVLGAAAPVLVDFTAPWCTPYRARSPILEQVALDLVKMNFLVRLATIWLMNECSRT